MSMTIFDVGTKFLGCYPLPNKTSEQAETALRHFIGTQKVNLLYSDGSGEIEAVAVSMGIPHDSSTPRVHETIARRRPCARADA